MIRGGLAIIELRTVARDTPSGLHAVRFAAGGRWGPWERARGQPIRETITIDVSDRGGKAPRRACAPARDRAGNVSTVACRDIEYGR